jgi:hypothetical protein
MPSIPRKWICLGLVVVIASTAAIVYIRANNLQTSKRDIVTLIAEEIIRQQENGISAGYRSPDNSIIIQIAASNANLDPTSWFIVPYIAAWKYENKKLIAAADVEVDKLIKERSAPLWVVVVRDTKNDSALVDVALQHGKSTTPGFADGGAAAHWKLKYSNGAWTLENDDTYYFWD